MKNSHPSKQMKEDLLWNTSPMLFPGTQKLVFSEGLLKDENDVYWIVKKKIANRYLTKNVPEHERLGYLLAQGKANLAEIRRIKPEEIENVRSIAKNTDEYYLTRVVTQSNMTTSPLPHQTPAQAFSAMFVANILMRKSDPYYGNISYSGSIPVSIDHDQILDYAETWPRFTIYYFYSLVLMTARQLADHRTEIVGELDLIRERVGKIGSYPSTLLQKIKQLIHDYGLGKGILAAEMLDKEEIRRTIREFKSVDNILDLARHAGYTGEGLTEVAMFIQQNQKTLGKDVNEIWKFLTDEDAGFDKLDEVLGDQSMLTVEQLRSDQAALAPEDKKGGIDLNPRNLDLQVEGRVSEFNLPGDTQMLRELESVPIKGFSPIIFRMTPVTDLPLLLGIQEARK